MPKLQDYLVLAVVVRELSKHQSASCLIVALVIARFASLSCYSSAKTRIQPVKSYQHGGEVSSSTGSSEAQNHSGSPVGYPEGSSVKKTPTAFIRSGYDDNPSGSKSMPPFDPEDLIGRTFLLPPEENGERHRAKVTRKVVEIID